MAVEKKVKLSCGGELIYKLPNCMEQVRFFVDARFNSHKYVLEQVESAIPFLDKFIVKIDSDTYKSFEEIIEDRSNVDALMKFALDIGNQSLDEDKKKS